MSSFDSAARKLAAAVVPYPLEDLPTDSSDEVWKEIRSTYGLLLPELAALKNYQRRQQEQQPPSPPPLPERLDQEQCNNLSTEILDSWCQRLPGVPNISELRSVVEAPLQKALPSLYSIDATDRPASDVISTTLTLQNSIVVPELAILQASVHALQKFGDNEDSVHSLVDTLILSPMSIIGRCTDCPFKINRNGVDSSGATIAKLRPDVLVWLPSGVLAFKGEDKATSSEIHQARNELTTKLNCFSDAYFGRMPYQICYVCGGNMLEFWAINRSAKPTLTAISTPVDLSTVRGRSLCLRYAVNISRLLVSLQMAFPEGRVARLGDTIKSESSVVNIFGQYVVKKTRHFTSGDVLKELYTKIQKSRVPGLVSCEEGVRISKGVLTLHVGPVGFCGKTPESVAETKIAGHRVLVALQWLHSNGWVHRDIRPQNIMFAESNWYLMDLEWANTIDSDTEGYHPNRNYLPPELIGGEGRPWTAACDMWQFGKLLERWNQLDNQGRSYVNTQIQDDPERRLSATDSLDHEFFA